MAQDPEGWDDGDDLPEPGSVDTSHALDMVPLYRSATVDSGVEADIIRGILESQGIPSMLYRAMGIPSLGFEVHVHRENLRDAKRVIEEAKAAGPGAALEAEEASENRR